MDRWTDKLKKIGGLMKQIPEKRRTQLENKVRTLARKQKNLVDKRARALAEGDRRLATKLYRQKEYVRRDKACFRRMLEAMV